MMLLHRERSADTFELKRWCGLRDYWDFSNWRIMRNWFSNRSTQLAKRNKNIHVFLNVLVVCPMCPHKNTKHSNSIWLNWNKPKLLAATAVTMSRRMQCRSFRSYTHLVWDLCVWSLAAHIQLSANWNSMAFVEFWTDCNIASEICISKCPKTDSRHSQAL